MKGSFGIKGLLISCGLFLFVAMTAVFIGPMDGLYHGYFSDRPTDIASAMKTQGVKFESKTIVHTITAKGKHLEALEVYLEKKPKAEIGEIEVELTNSKGELLAQKIYAVSNFRQKKWNKISIPKSLIEGESYVFTLYDKDGQIGDKVLLNCGYSKSSLTVFGKLLVIIILILAGVSFFALFCLSDSMRRKVLLYAVAPSSLVLLLSLTYFCNLFDLSNAKRHVSFQQDSDSLVLGRIIAVEEKIPLGKYGLGRVSDIKSTIRTMDIKRESVVPITSDAEGFVNGYSQKEPRIVLQRNGYTGKYLVAGNNVEFASGKRYVILSAKAGKLGWYVTFDTSDILSEETCGNIFSCKIFDKDGKKTPSYQFGQYWSQYGLQGKVMGAMSKIFNESRARWMSLLCSVLMAIMVLICSVLLCKKYNMLMAACFFIVFWLSPWVVNFAKSIYWVEFTWLMPFAGGLMIANWVDKKCVRWSGYLIIFFSVLIKSLCGYEYVTFIMLGAIWILGMDFIIALCKKDKTKAWKSLCVLTNVGIAALFGFIAALLIHADLRGNGDIWVGIKSIYERDVLRRTWGGDIDNFPQVMKSLQANSIEVLSRYFKFSTQIVTGLEANLFPLLAITPSFINAWNLYKKRDCMQDILLYVTAFVISISWHVFAKSHSYVHTHMNYVCWYYWFVPVCFYIILKQIKSSLGTKPSEMNGVSSKC